LPHPLNNKKASSYVKGDAAGKVAFPERGQDFPHPVKKPLKSFVEAQKGDKSEKVHL